MYSNTAANFEELSEISYGFKISIHSEVGRIKDLGLTIVEYLLAFSFTYPCI